MMEEEDFEVNINVKLLNICFSIRYFCECANNKQENDFDFIISVNDNYPQHQYFKNKKDFQNYFLSIFKKRPRPVDFVKKVGGYENYKKSLEQLSVRIVNQIINKNREYCVKKEKEDTLCFQCSACGQKQLKPPGNEGNFGGVPVCLECCLKGKVYESEEGFIDFEYETEFNYNNPPTQDIVDGVYSDKIDKYA